MLNHDGYAEFLWRQFTGPATCAAPLVVLALLIAIYQYRVRKVPFQLWHLVTLFPLVIPVLMLHWGDQYEHTTYSYRNSAAPPWPLDMLLWLFIGQLVLHAGCLAFMKGLRVPVLLGGLGQGFITFWAYMIAGMSISGSWL